MFSILAEIYLSTEIFYTGRNISFLCTKRKENQQIFVKLKDMFWNLANLKYEVYRIQESNFRGP